METRKNRFSEMYFLLSIFLLLFIPKVDAQDVGAITLVTPISPMCPDTNQTVTVTIQNFDAATIDFSVDTVTVTVDVTGASGQNFNVILNTGTLISGGKLNVVVTTMADMVANGVHVFDAYTTLAGDVDILNDSITPMYITVNDVTAPLADIANLPDLTAECSILISTIPTATDNCAGSVVGTTEDTLYYDEQGAYAITWTYDDGNGNTSTQTQNIIIEDVTAPVEDVATLPEITGECTVNVYPPTATDNCAGLITAVTTDPLTYNVEGTYTITWIYDDENGNISTQLQNVIVTPIDTSVTVAAPILTANNTLTGITYQWIDCNGNIPISGETNQSYSVTADGSYAVIVELDGCLDTSSCFLIVVTEIQKTTNSLPVVIYPNPTAGIVTINLPAIIRNKIIVYDVLGQIIISEEKEAQQITLDLSNYADGIYFIAIERGLSTQLFKIAKH